MIKSHLAPENFDTVVKRHGVQRKTGPNTTHLGTVHFQLFPRLAIVPGRPQRALYCIAGLCFFRRPRLFHSERISNALELHRGLSLPLERQWRYNADRGRRIDGIYEKDAILEEQAQLLAYLLPAPCRIQRP